MVDYRTPMGLVGVVLQAMRGGATLPEMAHNAYLPEAEVRSYLDVLVAKKLVELEKATLRYKPTKEGMDCLRLFDAIGELCNFELDFSRPREVVREQWPDRHLMMDEAIERLDRIIFEGRRTLN